MAAVNGKLPEIIETAELALWNSYRSELSIVSLGVSVIMVSGHFNRQDGTPVLEMGAGSRGGTLVY